MIELTTKQHKDEATWKQKMLNGFDVGHELVTSGAGTLTDAELKVVKQRCERTLKYVNQLLAIRGENK